jgi:osmoprotectant transport system permease protein
LAVLVSVPLGVAIAKVPALSPVLTVAGVIQTVPSLALLALMIPIPGLGLGARSAIAALFLYALLPILRNTATAILEVEPDLVEAARGLGMTEVQLLAKVELPLSVATIMAGIRTSTVISIGVATLAAFVGAGGLGDPIVTGLQLNDTWLILAGALPAAALAVVVDGLLHLVERALVPRGLG